MGACETRSPVRAGYSAYFIAEEMETLPASPHHLVWRDWNLDGNDQADCKH
ncbi:hypothetical protein SAMN02927900_04279 [Rhizobium mongolense subsp. loessense]|uniref:Uncharacterized protein n=1 Tax=Rhizobium mongolense subsp. loessense TaxID=158890 RepID=A0A1G4SYA5_9HYPH|nr:hypothetical protein SAMN02927900_04279 [Rhizobium mongolense subsp. loessense]